MDFGHNGKDASRRDSASEQPFFTAGQGNIVPERNDFEPENNIDLSNTETTWEITDSTPVPKAIFSPNTPESSSNTSESVLGHLETQAKPQDAISRPEQETISEETLKMPPSLPDFISDAPGSLDTFESKNVNFSEHSIRTEGDRLSKAALKEVESTISAFESTGNVADFYSAIRGDAKHPGMMQANLKNSFGREVGE